MITRELQQQADKEQNYIKPPFTFDSMVKLLRTVFKLFPDQRTGNNITYQVADAALSAFSGFFMQCPSFLNYQTKMLKNTGRSNMQSLFQADKIPCDNQIRNLLDPIDPSHLEIIFEVIFNGLLEEGYLDTYRSINDTLLFGLDGTRFHSSQNIHCDKCQATHHKNGDITYYHAAITPVIVAPGCKEVISLPPEFINPQDGATKQDCENTAAKRWLQAHAKKYQAQGITILGDDLYSRQPLCEAFKEQNFHFLLVCKEESHKTLYEWIAGLQIHTFVVKRKKGKKRYVDTYRYINNVPLRDGEDAMLVNWCELVSTNDKGEVIYKNAFVTDHIIHQSNCEQIVEAGRARWKIENENNNTLKTKGYHLEHNFGHGSQHLSNTLMTLNLLAFLFHTVLTFMDRRYVLIRKDLRTRKEFFHHIKIITTYHYFQSWLDMMNFMIEKLEIPIPSDTS